MVPQLEFREFAREIVVAVFPFERTAFDFGADEVLTDLYNPRDDNRTDTQVMAEYAFLSETAEVLKFVGLLQATFKILASSYTYLKQSVDVQSSQTLAKRWEEELI